MKLCTHVSRNNMYVHIKSHDSGFNNYSVMPLFPLRKQMSVGVHPAFLPGSLTVVALKVYYISDRLKTIYILIEFYDSDFWIQSVLMHLQQMTFWKHYVKSRNLSLWAISSFATLFSALIKKDTFFCRDFPYC